jgi:hypothetical protein
MRSSVVSLLCVAVLNTSAFAQVEESRDRPSTASSMTVTDLMNVPDPFPAIAQSKEYRDAFDMGVKEAEKELRNGTATLMIWGLQRGWFEHLDQETGLPKRPIARCVVGAEIFGREVGHNETIRKSITAHGLPSNSFKKWEKELFDLKGFWGRQMKTTQPIPLHAGGPLLKSPDGRFTIQPVKPEEKGSDGVIHHDLGLRVSGNGSGPRTEDIIWSGETDLLWGPQGSRFAVIRCRGKTSVDYMALDLQRVAWLRWEVESR